MNSSILRYGNAGSFVFLASMGFQGFGGDRVVRGLEDLPKENRIQLASGNIHRDGVEGPILAQSWVMYQNLKRLLEESGSSLDHMLHTIVFLRNIRQNWVAFDRVRQLMVKDPPPSMAIEMPRLGVSDDCLILMHVIAGKADKDRIQTERLTPDGELKARRLYGAGIKRMGPLVFAMGTGGVEPGTRRIIRGLEDLPEEVRRQLSTGDGRTDSLQGRVMAQTWVGYQNVKRYLESGGSSLENLLDEIVVLRDYRASWPSFDRVRRMVLKNPPPITVSETPRLGISDDLMVEIHDIGAVSSPDNPVQVLPFSRRVGEIVFTVATGGMEATTTDDTEGKHLPSSGMDMTLTNLLQLPMARQANTTIDALQARLKQAGSSLIGIRQLLVFMKDTPVNWPAFEKVWLNKAKEIPPMTLVESACLGGGSDCLVELHAVAEVVE